MSKNNFPNKISIFPLSNAVFFPKTMLPLNIFEERYIQLVKDCMKEEKMFGMVQPKYDAKNTKKPEVYKVGCLGKIISFNETADKRFVITLSGIIRFKIKEELENKKLYRKFNVDYSDFLMDLENKNLNEELKGEEEPKIFEKSDSETNLEAKEPKEPEMFENPDSEDDFEIPAFLRRQKN